MPSAKIKKIGVIGAGAMGRGIAQVFALYNYRVLLIEKHEAALGSALERIKEKTAPEMLERVEELIETSSDISRAAECDMVIEAVFEEAAVKKEVFRALNKYCRKDAIIASNTSAISITELAKELDNQERFIGMHFMNPPKVMKLIEIIKGEKTSRRTVEAVTDLGMEIEKVMAYSSDSPGFISNRLLFALIGEALRLVEAGVGRKEDVDTVMKYGMGHPMGPIELADFIGLDVCKEIMEYLQKTLGDERYRPTKELVALVNAGKLGRKSKEGFYKYA